MWHGPGHQQLHAAVYSMERVRHPEWQFWAVPDLRRVCVWHLLGVPCLMDLENVCLDVQRTALMPDYTLAGLQLSGLNHCSWVTHHDGPSSEQ